MKVYEEDHNDPTLLDKRTRVGGPIQSVLFYRETLRHLEQLGLKPNKNGNWVIHDYGCADGFGTIVLAAEWPEAKIVGIDINPHFVARANELFPTLDWVVGSIYEPIGRAGVIWCSHSLEHLERPLEAIRGFLENAEFMVVVVIPPVVDGIGVAHEGTMETQELFKKIDEEFVGLLVDIAKFTTKRMNVDSGKVLMETSYLLVFKGAA